MPNDRSRYFLIREAYLAKTIVYDLAAQFVTDLGGQAKVQNALTVKSATIVEGTSSYKLEQTFDTPLRTCIKSREIFFSTGAAGELIPKVEEREAVIPPLRIRR
jgi:hypothetical protein